MSETAYTNIDAINDFEEELERYESMIKPKSNHFHDFVTPGDILKGALVRLVSSAEADTYSMMRRLFKRMRAKIDDAYCEYALSMVAANTKDTRGKRLIMAVMLVSREVIMGENPDLNESWLQLVDNNFAIYKTLSNYAIADEHKYEVGYGGEILTPARPTEKMKTDDLEYVHRIGHANYDIRLTARDIQVVDFELDTDTEVLGMADKARPNIVVSDIILTPNIRTLAISRKIKFYDDAAAQISALKCNAIGVLAEVDTQIELPDMFYSLMINVVSHDSGATWRITEVNILPPSAERML
jgi:hypothetical protein